MKLFIPGGAGCLGSNLIEAWLPEGHEILVLDNFATGKREVVPEVKGLRVIEGSVADADLVHKLVADFAPDIVIHSAAAYKDPQNWLEDTQSNVIGSINVAKAAQALGVKKIINFQTALCYGNPTTLPVKENHPTAPFTSYGISKTAGEAFMLQSGVPTVSLRLANVTGPRLAIGPIPTFYKRLKAGQGCFCSDTARDFLDMSDFIALMNILLNQDFKTGIYNVSTGDPHFIKEIYEVVCEHLGLSAEGVPVQPPAADDVRIVTLDPSAVQKTFGWTPKVSFKETIVKQLKWYDAYGISDVFSHLKSNK